MELLLLCCIAFFISTFLLAPFPFWPSYLKLWRFALFGGKQSFSIAARFKQIQFLLGYAFLTPLFTALWWFDELLFPSYHDLTVRPVFILGQPRSGTTFLHRTLASDTDNFIAVRHIEWRLPFISIQKLIRRFPFFERMLQKSYWSNAPAGEIASRMHPNQLNDWEEDGIFFEERFLHHFFIFLRFPYTDGLEDFDDFRRLPKKAQLHILNIHNKVVKKALYINGYKFNDARRYLSKEVTSHSKFPEILNFYQDANFIFILRKSEGFMNSLLALMRYSTLAKTGVDPIEISSWKECVLSRMRRDACDLLKIVNSDATRQKSVILSYSEVTQSVDESVKKVYKHININFKSEYLQKLDELNTTQSSRKRDYDYEKYVFTGFEEYDNFVEFLNGKVQDHPHACSLNSAS